MKDALRALFESKKFLALLAGLFVWVGGKAGLKLTDDQILPALYLIGTYIGAQGLADLGKSKAQVEAQVVQKPRGRA